MTDISHIVTNGCSFTWGAELADRDNESWPAIVSRNLSVPFVNIARCGTGNDAIYRRTYEYFYEDLKNDNNPFYIIGFSAFTRREFWSNRQKRYKHFQYLQRSFLEKLNMEDEQKEILDNFDVEDLYRKTLLYKSSLKNLFIAHNVPYLFLDFMHMGDNEEEAENICKIKLPKLYSEIKNDTNSILSKLRDLLTNPGYCKRGHFDADTNRQIGNLITDNIRIRHDLNIVDKKFLTLSDYTDNLEPQYNSGERI